MESIEQKIVSKKELSLLIIPKITIYLTIIVGIAGAFSAPPSSSWMNPSIVNRLAVYLMSLLSILYLIFIFIGIIRYLLLLYKNGDKEKTKETRRFLWYSIAGLIVLMLFYSFSITLEEYPFEY